MAGADSGQTRLHRLRGGHLTQEESFLRAAAGLWEHNSEAHDESVGFLGKVKFSLLRMIGTVLMQCTRSQSCARSTFTVGWHFKPTSWRDWVAP